MILFHIKSLQALFYAACSNPKRHFSLVVSNNEVNKMTTQTAQTAQSYPKSTGGFKTLFAIIAGVFLFYAVQHHLITDLFVYLLSLVFDTFSIKVTGLIPDIIILIVLALLLLGIWHLLQFYLAATVILLAVAIIAGVMFSDDPAKTDSKGLSLLSHISSDKKGE